METKYQPISDLIYRKGNERQCENLFSCLAETNEFRKAQLKESLSAIFSQELKAQFEALFADAEMQATVRKHMAFHIHNYGLAEPMIAKNTQLLQKGLAGALQEARALGLGEGVVLSDVITGAAMKTGQSEEYAIGKFGAQLLKAAVNAGFNPTIIMNTSKDWHIPAPLGGITPAKTPPNVIAQLISDMQKLLQQTGEYREAEGKFLDAWRDKSNLMYSYLDAKVEEEKKGKPEGWDEKLIIAQVISDYAKLAVATSQANGNMPMSQLFDQSHLNGPDDHYRILFFDRKASLQSPPIFVQSPVA